MISRLGFQPESDLVVKGDADGAVVTICVGGVVADSFEVPAGYVWTGQVGAQGILQKQEKASIEKE